MLTLVFQTSNRRHIFSLETKFSRLAHLLIGTGAVPHPDIPVSSNHCPCNAMVQVTFNFKNQTMVHRFTSVTVV